MRGSIPILFLSTALLAGCSSAGGGYGLPIPGSPSGDVVVVSDERGERGGEIYGARSPDVPKGHYPPPGECRLWYPGRPPGHQPPPAACDRLMGRVPYGAFVLYNDKAWDTRYDWERHERESRGSVPGVILRLMRSLRQ